MTTALQLRRDTTSNILGITPAQGEVLYDTNRKALVVGDGATAGGLTATPFAGTWTPQLQFGGANSGMTFSARSGVWVQIGQLVYAQWSFTLSAKGSSTGTAAITGLPVNPTSNAGATFQYEAALASEGASSITVTASPFVYANNDGADEYVTVSSGTVSSIGYVRGGTGPVGVAAASNFGLRLFPGDAVSVTYSGAPTMQKFIAPASLQGYAGTDGAIRIGRGGGTTWSQLSDIDFTATSRIDGIVIYEAAQPTG